MRNDVLGPIGQSLSRFLKSITSEMIAYSMGATTVLALVAFGAEWGLLELGLSDLLVIITLSVIAAAALAALVGGMMAWQKRFGRKEIPFSTSASAQLNITDSATAPLLKKTASPKPGYGSTQSINGAARGPGLFDSTRSSTVPTYSPPESKKPPPSP